MSIPYSNNNAVDAPAPFPFPVDRARAASASRSDVGERVLQGFEAMSRRIDDLARELNCLGYFDDEDRPRAA